MNDKDLECLLILAEEKNISRAAQKLYMTQPSLTHKLRRIERELGAPLFVRRAHGIELTAAGELASAYAAQARSDWLHLRERVAQTQCNEIAGTLRLGVSNVFAKSRLPGLMAEFQQKYPLVRVHLKTGFSQNLYSDFLHGDLHITIIRDLRNWSDQHFLILREPLCLFCARPVTLDELPSVPYVHYRTGTPLQQILDEWWLTRFRKKPEMVTSVDSMDICIDMVRAGLGFTFLSESFALRCPELYCLPLRRTNGHFLLRSTRMYVRRDTGAFPVTRAFTAHVLDRYPALKEDELLD